MDSKRRLEQKEFSTEYYDFFMQTKREISKLGLNKFAEKEAKNQAFDKIYENFKNGENVDNALGKNKFKELEKITKNKPRKNLAEIILETFFNAFVCLTSLFFLIYFLVFTKSTEYNYVKGIYLYLRVDNMLRILLVAILVLGVLLVVNKALFKTNYPKSAIITSLGFIGVLSIFTIILSNLPKDKILQINFLISELVLLIITIGLYFLYRHIYSLNYKKYKENHK